MELSDALPCCPLKGSAALRIRVVADQVVGRTLCGKARDWRKLKTHQTARNARHSSAKLLNLKKNSAIANAIRNGTASCFAATRTPRSLISENMSPSSSRGNIH